MSAGLAVVVSSAYRWKNGMVMVFDTTGRQVPQLQGEYCVDLHRRIRQHSSHQTKWFGFGEDGPVEWPHQ